MRRVPILQRMPDLALGEKCHAKTGKSPLRRPANMRRDRFVAREDSVLAAFPGRCLAEPFCTKFR